MRTLLKQIDGRDALAVVGLMLLTAGLALVSAPAALIVLGAVLLTLSIGPAILAALRYG